ncbi:uncharacterized protein LOC114053595 [Vombatus ursinus]|uniref:uncharacterized protein LOC114053595 n=1 Tax=Vombatus ursinus TaxID=29139 RepID=UPI000FFD136C|nr:uncharacterized protein LOC114053595 [Vombatus ursinus]
MFIAVTAENRLRGDCAGPSPRRRLPRLLPHSLRKAIRAVDRTVALRDLVRHRGAVSGHSGRGGSTEPRGFSLGPRILLHAEATSPRTPDLVDTAPPSLSPVLEDQPNFGQVSDHGPELHRPLPGIVLLSPVCLLRPSLRAQDPIPAGPQLVALDRSTSRALRPKTPRRNAVPPSGRAPGLGRSRAQVGQPPAEEGRRGAGRLAGQLSQGGLRCGSGVCGRRMHRIFTVKTVDPFDDRKGCAVSVPVMDNPIKRL